MGTSSSSVKGNSVILERNNSRLQYVVVSNQLKRKCREGPGGPGGKDACERSMCTCKEGQKCSACIGKSYQQIKVEIDPFPLLTPGKATLRVLCASGLPSTRETGHAGVSLTKGH